MMCVKPISIDGATYPCGKCVTCRIARTKEWTLRLMMEYYQWDVSCFITLTYEDKHLPLGLVKKDLQNYIKRLRKDIEPEKLKYFACGEYGENTFRPHYHAIIFGLAANNKLLKENWNYGFIRAGTVTYDSCRYVAGYVQKKYTGKLAKETYGDLQPPFQLQSQGLAKQFLLDNKEMLAEKMCMTIHGIEHALPRYYVKKLREEELIDEQKMELKKIERGNEFDDYCEKNGIEKLERFQYLRDLRKQVEKTTKDRISIYNKKTI